MLLPGFFFVPLHPLLHRIDNILVHAFANGGGSGLYIIFLSFWHCDRYSVKVCRVPFAVPLFAGVCVFLRRQLHPSLLLLSVSNKHTLNK